MPSPRADGVILPKTLPVFPLPGALLLPRGQMPLNIFEPRYLAMVDAALGIGRIIADQAALIGVAAMRRQRGPEIIGGRRGRIGR